MNRQIDPAEIIQAVVIVVIGVAGTAAVIWWMWSEFARCWG